MNKPINSVVAFAIIIVFTAIVVWLIVNEINALQEALVNCLINE